MAELSRDEIVSIVGPLDDNLVAAIIATGATKDGVATAYARVVTDRETHDPGLPLEPGPVARVIEILERSHQAGLLNSPLDALGFRR